MIVVVPKCVILNSLAPFYFVGSKTIASLIFTSVIAAFITKFVLESHFSTLCVSVGYIALLLVVRILYNCTN